MPAICRSDEMNDFMKSRSSVDRLNNNGYFFVAPFVIVMLIFSIYPVIRTIGLSFTGYKGYGAEEFTELDNYFRVFKDKLFWKAFGNTLKIWIPNIIVQMGFALALTLIFSDVKYKIKGLGIFRAVYYLPNLISVTSVSFLFKSLLDWKYGSVNQLLMTLKITDEQINWLGQPETAQMAVSLIGAWMWYGSTFIMLMAGVQGISKDYFEAAVVDGAGRWTIFRKITLPLLKPVMLYVIVTSLIGGLQIFELPYLISGTKGDPQRSLTTAVSYIYNTAFTNHQFGYASAMAFVLFVIIAAASMAAFRIMNSKDNK